MSGNQAEKHLKLLFIFDRKLCTTTGLVVFFHKLIKLVFKTLVGTLRVNIQILLLELG